MPLAALTLSLVFLERVLDDDAFTLEEVACVSAAPPLADDACDLDARSAWWDVGDCLIWILEGDEAMPSRSCSCS